MSEARSVLVLVAIVFIGCVQFTWAQSMTSQGKVTMEVLRKDVAGRLANIPNVASVKRHAVNRLAVRTRDNRDYIIGLDNLFDSLRGNAAEAESIIADFVSATRTTALDPRAKAPSAAEFAAKLLPVVENRSFVADFNRASGRSAPQMLAKPLAGDIVIAVALDREQGVQMLASGSGQAYSLTDEELFARAQDNLRAKLKLLRLAEVGSVKLVDYESDFNANFMFLDELWSTLAPGREDEVVIAVPSRDMLAFGFASDPEAIKILRKIAAIPDRPYPVSKMLFRRNGRGWDAFR